MMTTGECLFETESLVQHLSIGQRVNARLSWGDEPGLITGFQQVATFPMVQVVLDMGMTALINVANVTPEMDQ